ncbi:MAG: Globin-coupled histidine kinase [Firmicutes bacterium ADurb.Bin419]|nr:MAG: Globin-coupled histidine kinase [Firmicutes bacterium ADurb.Bin419]
MGKLSYIIKADYAHLRECFCNIICNAIEAADTDVKINIRVVQQGRFLVVIINDNGPGISDEHIPYLFEPFYSTKKNNNNFGLGLFYCNNVMRRHEGTLEISSSKGKGTKVTLTIPEKRIISKQLLLDA